MATCGRRIEHAALRVRRLDDKVKMPNVSKDFVQDLSVQNVASTPEI